MYAILSMEGRIVNDPEFKRSKEGREFVTFRIVVNQQFGAQETASFFSCTGNEFIANRIRKSGLGKGRLIHVIGNLTMREYTKQNGTQSISGDVGIMDWHYVGTKPKSEESQNAGYVPAQNNGCQQTAPQYGRQQPQAQYTGQQSQGQYSGQQPQSQYSGQQPAGQYGTPYQSQQPVGQYPKQQGGYVHSEQYIGSSDDLPV